MSSDLDPSAARVSAQLDHLAARCVTDPTFLAHQLAAYATRHRLTDQELAEQLGVTPAGLTRLRLCGRIRIETPAIATEDIRTVAAGIGCDAAALARAVLM